MRQRIWIFFCLFFFLLSCTSSPQTYTTFFYAYRFDPPAFLEFSADLALQKEIPFSIPRACGLLDVFAAPVGKYLLVELSCPNGQTVLFLDTDSGSVTQPVTDTDSHFLAWSKDGQWAYLKLDSLGNTRIVQMSPSGKNKLVPVTEFSYDLSMHSDGDAFTFTFSRGMGQGSEIWLAKQGGKSTQQLYADSWHYISYARYSPDGSQLAFIKIPDSEVPFTVGELWVVNADGSQPRKLADADAGHGYAANWSPDGKWIAFVQRENPEDERADQSSEALISNIYMVEVTSGAVTQLTTLTEGRAETPHWSPDGNTLAFTTVLNGRMNVQIADISSGQIRSIVGESTCCAAWIRK